MAITRHVIQAPPEQVFAVLADGWTYSDWVVGTAHIRDVDPHWPAEGANLYHKVGPWPLSVRDRSVVLSCKEPSELAIRARMWPLGEATVHIRLAPVGEGATRVEMFEDFAAGPLRAVHTKINDVALHYRNVESLRRLSDLAMRRAAAARSARSWDSGGANQDM